MVTIRFRELSVQAHKNLPCPVCGKKVRRQRTFTQTLNPFNRNADGVVKTPKEIYAELDERAGAWKAEAVVCTPCSERDGEVA